MTLRHAADWLVRTAVVLGCLAYALWGVELDAFASAIGRYEVAAALTVVAVGFIPYGVMGLRLHLFMYERPGIGLCTSASVLALGVNNIVPAKLGELVKVGYLSRHGRLTTARVLSVVFWERFADLNALLALVLAGALILDFAIGIVPLAGLVVGLWVVVWVARVWPSLPARTVAWIPSERLRVFVEQLNIQVQSGLALRRVFVLVACTGGIWLLYVVQIAVLMVWTAGFPLNHEQVLVVFVATSLAMMLPAGPGGIGVVEAAMVLALGWFGVPKAEALAAAVFLHLSQYVPTTLFAVLLLGRKAFVSRSHLATG